jgi:hypothetical protein
MMIAVLLFRLTRTLGRIGDDLRAMGGADHQSLSSRSIDGQQTPRGHHGAHHNSKQHQSGREPSTRSPKTPITTFPMDEPWSAGARQYTQKN